MNEEQSTIDTIDDSDALGALIRTRNLNEPQAHAVRRSVDARISCITGGPGVGKTYTARTVAEHLRANGFRTAFCAPTGKAAKRLRDMTGEHATTIHRLLEPAFNPANGRFSFTRNEDEPLEVDVVVCDETSMVDVPLAAALIRALPAHGRLIFIGDTDQLPSVGPGCFLLDLIRSGLVPTFRLTQIVRQAEGSEIIKNAHRVNNGMLPIHHPKLPPPLAMAKDIQGFLCARDPDMRAFDGIDFVLISEATEATIVHTAVHLVRLFNAQILVPMHKPEVGTRNLNSQAQATLNPIAAGMHPMSYGQVEFREGDKVMNLVNDYQRGEHGVFNGDHGVIVKIDPDKKVVEVEMEAITRDGELVPQLVQYAKQDLHMLTHAWAISIHKSQGCEWDNVVVCLHSSHFRLLQRNLLYTAMTRAKQRVFLITGEKALRQAVANTQAGARNSLLREMLLARVEERRQSA